MALRFMEDDGFVVKKMRGDHICRVACYFTILPDTKDHDIVSEFNGDQYFILDNKTLEIKGKMKRIGGWYKKRVDDPPGSLVITPELLAMSVPAPKGQLSTIFFELSINIKTGRSFVMSYLVEKRKTVRLIEQFEVPFRNKPGNYACDIRDGRDGWFYVLSQWCDENRDSTMLSLVRVKADYTAKIESEKLADQREIKGHWHYSLVKSGFLWFLTSKQMMKHSLDGKVSEFFELAPHEGLYPPSWDMEMIDLTTNYIVAKFYRGLERSIWALDMVNWKWIDLSISFSVDAQYGITGNAVTPEGLVYLLGQGWSADNSHEVGTLYIHQFDVHKRLKQIIERYRSAQAADLANTMTKMALTASASGRPPPAYHELEVEEKAPPPAYSETDAKEEEKSAEVTEDDDLVTRL